jgi:CubicO group peptidase (beta-lactamase class C family)
MIELERHIDATHPQIFSFLVERGGQLIFERYYNGKSRSDPANIQSVTKSVTSALVGIALKQGKIKHLDQTLASLRSELFPEFPVREADARKGDITVRHLLSMSSGLDWDEWEDTEVWSSDDWAEYMLALPLSDEPGSTFNYNSAAFHLLSVLITKTTGLNALEFGRRYLFDPLGITVHRWATDPQGNPIGSSELLITPRDMAKLGRLYHDGGRWGGEEIVPAHYVAESVREQSSGGFPEEAAYGYGWWVATDPYRPNYMAAGYGGQYVYVMPTLDAVAVITANPYLPPQEVDDYRYLVEEFVIPALVDPSTSWRGEQQDR